MYLSKTTKRNIILMILFVLIAGGVTAFLMLQKPKLDSASITGSGYMGSSLNVSVLPLEATATYQWKIADAATGPFTDINGATSASLNLSLADVGKYVMVTVKGSQDYAGKVDSQIFGPIKGVTVTWPSTTPIVYGQSLRSSLLGNGTAQLNGVLVDGSFAFENIDAIPSEAGTYKANVIFTPSDITKYNVVTAAIDVIVEKAQLTVTVKNVTLTYGDPIPVFEYEISGFVMGDDLTAVSGAPSITSLYTPGLSVSYSPIQIIAELGTLQSGNYSFNYVFGELTIAKRVLTISGLTGVDKTYDGTTVAEATGRAVLNNLFPGDAVSLGGNPTYTFATKLAGDNIKITVKGFRLYGAKALNYTLVQPTLYADIRPLVLP